MNALVGGDHQRVDLDHRRVKIAEGAVAALQGADHLLGQVGGMPRAKAISRA
jgi:hypothetical protein